MITLRDVLAGTGGTLAGRAGQELLLRRVRHDSREVGRGDLFVAVVGERLDGHDYVPAAFERGAAAALIDSAHLPALVELGRPLVVVEDTVAALQRLARYWRSLFDVTVIGITGSVGKSSTKEVVASIASQRFQTVWSKGSFNNEIGLPLSLTQITPDTDVVVLEMGGGYAFGEIEMLCEIAKPQIGIVTNVSHSHLSRMGSLEAIAQTKLELPASLPPDGVALLNGDDERVRAMAEHCGCRVVFYGLGSDCEVRALDAQSHGLDGISFRLMLDGTMHHLRLPLLGRHSVHTALGGIGVGWLLGMRIDEILPGFSDPSIQLRLYTAPGINGSLIIDDTYNANPASSIAALNLLAELSGRRIAVLGDMLELGSYEGPGHRQVGRRAAVVVDQLFTFGDRARLIAEEARASGLAADAVQSFNDKQALVDRLRELLRPGDVVLVKGSRGMQMEQVVDGIRDQKAEA